MAAGEGVWSFGYGSNMDMVALEHKKGIRVLEHCPAVLGDFRLTFGTRGIDFVEPGYAGLRRAAGEEVHGIAFCMGQEGVEKLDKVEQGYHKEMVSLRAYDGRALEGFVYMPRTKSDEEYLPSPRYLGVLCKGAQQAGLDPTYITALAARQVYSSGQEVAVARQEREEARLSLKEVTVEELATHRTEEPCWVSCLGFVLKVGSWLGSHEGRNITSRVLMQFHGIPMDKNDDGGRAPFPLVSGLSPEEVTRADNCRL
jgi:gamma-glutamylcyclotransferase (GGCT)/AIG2-like uncharacterized protein YtfP